MLRFVAAARRHLRVQSLQPVRVPNHLASVLANAPPHCKCLRRHYSSSESAPCMYQVPSVIRPDSRLVWQKTVKPALRTYLKLKKDLLIPIKFTVPINDNNWPKETRGYPLGKHAERLRQYGRKGKLPDFAVQDLLEMDFAFDFSQYRWDHFVMPALRRYHELYGDSDVHFGFRVKAGDSKWPEKLWGLKLGFLVDGIRNKGNFKAQVVQDVETLTKINFCFESSIIDRDWDKRVLPSLVTYHQEFGNCDVPQSFEVPDCSPWPKAAAGLRLGQVVNNMRRQTFYVKQSTRDADVLKKLGFVWDHFWAKWNDRIFPAFEMFKRENGHGKIPQHFVVPCTTPWPKKSHDLPIGVIVNNIRYHGLYFDQIARSVDLLAALGFEFPVAQKRWDQRVEPMLATFEELHGHRDVPIDFVVPSEAPWNEMDGGIQLGKLKRKEQ